MQQLINLTIMEVDNLRTTRIEVTDGIQTFKVTESINPKEYLNEWTTNWSNRRWRYPTYAYLALFKWIAKRKHPIITIMLRFRTKAQTENFIRVLKEYGYQYKIGGKH